MLDDVKLNHNREQFMFEHNIRNASIQLSRNHMSMRIGQEISRALSLDSGAEGETRKSSPDIIN